MILDKILGNIKDMKDIHCHIERVYLESDELLKRVLRVTSDHGHEYGISLPKGSEMKDGDILFNDGHNIIVISVKEDDVIVITPRDINEMGEIAHNLGNKHLPIQIEDGKIIIQYDYLIEKFLQDLKVNFERKNMKLKQAFRHVDHSH
ncbi:urease accessory protein UreE [Fusobacterium perfoetens]|uniref:urease accessory protein UreE n=1 Tax=Fusobacterium perfoetens TaxID=852 RepID=UPI001F2DD438|nr:urease accessory protein UreE [Fusobacterium perfoetens]MCF2626028.1 urease accessory protein UreE [Fusobacterium perfoetens]